MPDFSKWPDYKEVEFQAKDIRDAFKLANGWLSSVDVSIDSVLVQKGEEYGYWEVKIFFVVQEN